MLLRELSGTNRAHSQAARFALAAHTAGAQWDDTEIDGDLEARDCSILYRRGGKKLAQAMIHDLEGLRVEVSFERAVTEARRQVFASEDVDAPSRRSRTTE